MNLHIECTIAGEDLPPAKAQALRDLIIQPQRLWFSLAERAYVEGALQGRFAGLARDCFTTAWLNDEPVGNVMVGVARSAPQVGLLSFVFTRPDQRGLGIAGTLMREAIARFRAGGGVCVHLGTDNPSARRVYAGCGFRDYNGHVMRFLDAGDSDQAFDDSYFANSGPTSIRPGHWGDLARIGFLYAAPHPWFIKDYAERLYGAPEIEQARVGSILPSMMLNTTERGGALWVMENQEGHVVGAATVTCLDQTAQRHAPLLDFLVAPACVAQAGELVQTAIAGLRGGGSRQVWAYVAACDQDKATIVRAAGFGHVARLPGALSAGERCCDLDVYLRPVPSGARPASVLRRCTMGVSDRRVIAVGCGSIGRRHARLLAQRPGVALELCDVSADNLRRALDETGPRLTYTTFQAALASRPDMVVIATPHGQHADQAVRALRAGCHVLCEKPMSDTLAGARRMLAAAQASGKVFTVGFNQHFHPAMRQVRDIIRSGELGNVLHVHWHVGTYITLLNSGSRYQSTMECALFLDYVHQPDLLHWWLGRRPSAVFTAGLRGGDLPLQSTPNVAAVTMEYDGGALATIHLNYVQFPQRTACEIIGDKKWLLVDLMNNTMHTGALDGGAETHSSFSFERDEMYVAEHQAFLDAVDGKRPPESPAEDAIVAQEMVMAAMKSWRLGRRVRL